MKAFSTNLSIPLQQLKDEHITLREIMDRFYDIAEEIEFESGSVVAQLFAKLHSEISDFTVRLKVHSKREDDGLFPMMARHLGEEDRTIETMEYEHEKAEQHLEDFLTATSEMGENVDEEDAQSVTVHAVQAYATLTQHFAKEETVLFPLAERLLTVCEKKELERFFET